MTVLICNNCKSIRYLAGIFDEDIKNQYTCGECSSKDILAIDEYSDSIPNEYNVVIQRLKIDKLQKEFNVLRNQFNEYTKKNDKLLERYKPISEHVENEMYEEYMKKFTTNDEVHDSTDKEDKSE